MQVTVPLPATWAGVGSGWDTTGVSCSTAAGDPAQKWDKVMEITQNTQ